MATRRGFLGMLAGAIAAPHALKPLLALAKPASEPIQALVYHGDVLLTPPNVYADYVKVSDHILLANNVTTDCDKLLIQRLNEALNREYPARKVAQRW
jgi:hypothetical protein